MADFRPLTPEEVPAAAAPEAPVAARNWGLSHLPFTFKYEGSFPDALKIKKKLNLGPLQLSLAGVWERKSKDFYSKVSVKVRHGVHHAGADISNTTSGKLPNLASSSPQI